MIKIDKLFPQVASGHLQSAQQGLDRLLSRKDLGFFQLLERSSLWESSQQRAQELRGSGVRRAVVLGMGGSSLGPKTLWESYGCWQGQLDELLFFDNLDATSFFRRLERLEDPRSVHFILISKSGTTLETLAMADYVDQFLRGKGSSLATQCTAISELKSNPLSDWARENQVPLLEIPEDVGGRFSVLTPVGLLPAALMGCSLDDMREGMKCVLEQTEVLVQLIAADWTVWSERIRHCIFGLTLRAWRPSVFGFSNCGQSL